MLFCLPPPMKRLSRSLLALAGFGRRRAPGAVLRPPRVARAVRRHALRCTCWRRPGDARPDDRRPRKTELRVAEMMFRPLVGHRRASSRPVPALAKSWTVSPGRPDVRVPPRPGGHLGDGIARDLGRRALHDRAHPGPEGQRRRPGAAASRNSPRSRRRIPATVRVRFSRPYAERMLAFNLPIVSAAAYGRAKSRGRDRPRARRERAVPASRRGSPTGSIRLTRRPDAAGRRVSPRWSSA